LNHADFRHGTPKRSIAVSVIETLQRQLQGVREAAERMLADYPPVEEVLDFMRQRRTVLFEILASLTDDQLTAALPEGAPDFFPNLGGAFEMAVWHEGLHLGQITVARRALGHEPVRDRVE